MLRVKVKVKIPKPKMNCLPDGRSKLTQWHVQSMPMVAFDAANDPKQCRNNW